MPELPEVETLKRGLQTYLVGHMIESVDVRLPKVLSGKTEHIIGAKITQIKRFGKGIVIELSNGYAIAVHIKLTGQLIYQGSAIPKSSSVSKTKVGTLPNPFTHIIIYLDRGARLYYNDMRQFGWLKIVRSEEIKNLPFFKSLGPEMFRDLTAEKFKTVISSSKTAIKPLIMDQTKVGGIGNIYANDSLFLAKILPTRPANTLSEEEIERLYEAIKTVFTRGLRYGGASELTYVNALGEEGSYQKHFLVYGKKGKECTTCGGAIQKIMLGGRGTFFCTHCQR